MAIVSSPQQTITYVSHQLHFGPSVIASFVIESPLLLTNLNSLFLLIH